MMKLTRSTLTFNYDGKELVAHGEALLRVSDVSPDFVLYIDSLNNFENGEIINEETREKIILAIKSEAALKKINIEFE